MKKIIVAPEISKKFEFNLQDLLLENGRLIELNFVVNQAAKIDITLIGIGELNLDVILNLDLVGFDAQISVKGAFLLNQASKIRFNVLQNHFTPNAQSRVLIKTVLLDQAQFNYDGMITIAEHASGTIANQLNQNIVLSPEVTVISVPKIEVLNSDVQCGHGSAIGGLDQGQMIYLMSRGLNRDQATNLLVQSFLGIDLSDRDMLAFK